MKYLMATLVAAAVIVGTGQVRAESGRLGDTSGTDVMPPPLSQTDDGQCSRYVPLDADGQGVDAWRDSLTGDVLIRGNIHHALKRHARTENLSDAERESRKGKERDRDACGGKAN